jgi:hypothetical protein
MKRPGMTWTFQTENYQGDQMMHCRMGRETTLWGKKKEQRKKEKRKKGGEKKRTVGVLSSSVCPYNTSFYGAMTASMFIFQPYTLGHFHLF